ncbi:MAG: hypothetical protein CM1200mP10_11720 [Candidatus Neomarinimicrobiota bacterium]|nr:MAG: hypothetical protein CM1200mP10_11720 [Candidatus Neomarinimicrobiota bacterium]
MQVSDSMRVDPYLLVSLVGLKVIMVGIMAQNTVLMLYIP